MHVLISLFVYIIYAATTIACMLALIMSPQAMIDSGSALGLGHFYNLFNDEITNYLRKLTSRQKPKAIVVCMIYFPDEVSGGGWAENVLSMLGYNSNPHKLQSIIRKVFEEAMCKISIEGTRVIPFPLFKVLDGKTSGYYTQRVEPSQLGGEQMGKAIIDAIVAADDGEVSRPL